MSQLTVNIVDPKQRQHETAWVGKALHILHLQHFKLCQLLSLPKLSFPVIVKLHSYPLSHGYKIPNSSLLLQNIRNIFLWHVQKYSRSTRGLHQLAPGCKECRSVKLDHPIFIKFAGLRMTGVC